MPKIGYRTIRTVLEAMHVTGVARLLSPLFRGEGAILTLHRVCPPRGEAFSPNGLLEITPDFLDAVLTQLRADGYAFVTLDEALRRLPSGGGRFVAVTLDDGYRDNLVHAAPIFRRHGCPYTIYCVPDFLAGEGELWWLGLEESLRRLDRLTDFCGEAVGLDLGSPAAKEAAYDLLYARLRAMGEPDLRKAVRTLCREAGFDLAALCAPLCLSWAELEAALDDPLLSVGAHTISHPRLATLPREVARSEIEGSRAVLERRCGRRVRHFSYPVGDATSAGPREFALCAEIGFDSAVTTRPGVLHRRHADQVHALPRISLNGFFQDLRHVRTLMSGVPFAPLSLWRGDEAA